jgi:4-hydroxybenzoate polyprenyltransferase
MGKNSNPKIDSEFQRHTAALRLDIKKRSDRLMNYFLIGFFVAGLLFAFFYNTWFIAIGVGGFSLLAYYSIKSIFPQFKSISICPQCGARNIYVAIHLPDARVI